MMLSTMIINPFADAPLTTVSFLATHILKSTSSFHYLPIMKKIESNDFDFHNNLMVYFFRKY